jgi:hypothetical protein
MLFKMPPAGNWNPALNLYSVLTSIQVKGCSSCYCYGLWDYEIPYSGHEQLFTVSLLPLSTSPA